MKKLYWSKNIVLLFFTLSCLGTLNFLAAFHEICCYFTEILENVWLCSLCIFEPKKKLWWFWIPWDQNAPLKFHNAFYIWHHLICIWVLNCKIPLQKFASILAPTFVLFQVILRQQKIAKVLRLKKKIELNFMSWRIKNRYPKKQRCYSYDDVTSEFLFSLVHILLYKEMSRSF